MSISTDAVIMVGLEGKEFTEEFLDRICDSEELYCAFPWYDADPEDCYFGLVVAKTYNGGELDLKVFDQIPALQDKFFKMSGLIGKLYLTSDVC